MEISQKKCSFEDHKEIDANYYCIQCGINFCNKCNIFHSKLLKNHQIFQLDKNIKEMKYLVVFVKKKAIIIMNYLSIAKIIINYVV